MLHIININSQKYKVLINVHSLLVLKTLKSVRSRITEAQKFLHYAKLFMSHGFHVPMHIVIAHESHLQWMLSPQIIPANGRRGIYHCPEVLGRGRSPVRSPAVSCPPV